MSNTQPRTADQSNTQPSLEDPQPNSRIDQDMHRLGNPQQTPVHLLVSLECNSYFVSSKWKRVFIRLFIPDTSTRVGKYIVLLCS